MNKTEVIKSWFSRRVEEEMQDEIPHEERVTAIAIIVFNILLLLYSLAHQMSSTGFFTAAFGLMEALLLYGSLLYWIVESVLLLSGRKNLSRNLESFGGLAFVMVSIAWLLLTFPFDFAYYADVLPDVFRFLVQWMTNEIAQVLMILGIIVHLVTAIYSVIVRMLVRKARRRE